MQMNSSAILFLITVVAIVLSIVISRLFRVKPECIKCGSKDIIETHRETLGSRSAGISSGYTLMGRRISIQLDFDVTYRCKECGEIFKRRFSETQ